MSILRSSCFKIKPCFKQSKDEEAQTLLVFLLPAMAKKWELIFPVL